MMSVVEEKEVQEAVGTWRCPKVSAWGSQLLPERSTHPEITTLKRVWYFAYSPDISLFNTCCEFLKILRKCLRRKMMMPMNDAR